ncbi:MAG: dihydrolipoyl dehydrogenase [Dehalococcoidia bacterium]|nr:dihydrolipoyl dehydrogenase [Dehalococcoidia bacterium]
MSGQDETFDLVVVGGGTGGYVASIRAAQLGLRVALVEKDKIGGACLHRGCIPTKVLLESAEVYSLVRRAEEFGVMASDPRFDYARILHRKDSIVNRLYSGIQFLMKKNRITVIEGRASLIAATTLVVTGIDGSQRELNGRDVILATGSEPKSLPGLEVDGDRILTSDHIFGLPEAPSSLIIIGAGAIGVEFASLFSDLGARVSLVEVLPNILPLEDQEISQELEKVFKRRGIRVLTGARLLTETLAKRESGLEVQVETAGQRETLSGERMLVAVGRRGLVEGLGLEQLGVRTERGYVVVDKGMSTGIPHLYAIGDLIGGMLLAHVAMAEGVLAVETITGAGPAPLDYNRVPRGVYSRPQIGSLGLTEQEAMAKAHKVKVGRFPFRANGRALIAGDQDGLVKVVAESDTGELLGVHIIGPQATELIMEPALAMFLESTAWELGTSIRAHPTLAEAIGEAALAVAGKAIHI